MSVNANDMLQKIILILIYTCHMPMFFVLSGYVFKVEDNPNILDFANKKLKRLMLPYILFIVIDTTMEVFLHIYSLNEIKEKILSGYPDIVLITTKSIYSSLWFFPVLFWSLIIAYELETKIRKAESKILISLLWAISCRILHFLNIESYLGIREALLVQLFVLMGYEFKNGIRYIIRSYSFSKLLMISIVWVYAIYEWTCSGYSLVNYWNFDLPTVFWPVMIAFIGIIWLLNVIGFLREAHWSRICSLLSKIGMDSLYIYGFHYIFLNTFKKYLVGKFDTPMITWIVALLILVSTVIFTEAYKYLKTLTLNYERKC